MKEDERHVYGLCKDDVEGYVELSEVTGGMFDQSRQGWYSYIKDQVGTIYKVYSDNAKQIIDTRTYDTFGNLIDRIGTSTGNLGFQGKYYDTESGLYYFYNRYYNPTNGRFINEDPIGLNDGLNMYGFVLNNPVNRVDPYGLECALPEWLLQIFEVGPLDALTAKNLASDAYDVSESGILPVTEISVKGGVVDAFRHCYWSCRMAQEIGKKQALKVGILHEKCASPSQSCEEKQMDLYNNQMGIKLSEYGKCKELCIIALSIGWLKYLRTF